MNRIKLTVHSDPHDPSRKMKIARVDGLVSNIINHGDDLTLETDTDVPADLSIVGKIGDDGLLLYSETWEDTPLGVAIPRLDGSFKFISLIRG